VGFRRSTRDGAGQDGDGRRGDKLRVTCTHDASLRQKIPSLTKLQPRYVVWGEGSSDEMCLGIVSYTQP